MSVHCSGGLVDAFDGGVIVEVDEDAAVGAAAGLLIGGVREAVGGVGEAVGGVGAAVGGVGAAVGAVVGAAAGAPI